MLRRRGLDSPPEPDSPLDRTLAEALHLPLPGLTTEVLPLPRPSPLCAVEGKYSLRASQTAPPTGPPDGVDPPWQDEFQAPA